MIGLSLKRAHVVVEGRVQGVYFRQSMKQVADALGVMGWVRNLDSGAVEAVVEGDELAVNQLIEWSRHGPARAAVDDVHIDWQVPGGGFAGFSIRR